MTSLVPCPSGERMCSSRTSSSAARRTTGTRWPDEVAACSGYLKAQIELLNPRVIATLGRHSLLRFVPDARISRDHGTIKRWQGRVIYPLYHPAAALRSTQVMQATVEDFKRLPQAILAALTPVESATPNDRAQQHADQPTEKPGTTDQSIDSTGYSDATDEDEQMTMFLTAIVSSNGPSTRINSAIGGISCHRRT